MKAIISFVAVCGILTTAMVPSYPANAATRIEICMKNLMANGVALGDFVPFGGYCYDGRRCPKMNELLGITSSDKTGNVVEAHSGPKKPLELSGYSPEKEAAKKQAAAAADEACNACTSGGKPLCVSQ